LAELAPDIVVTDLRMPVLDGMGVLQATMDHDSKIPVLILTAHGTIESAVEAVKRGAFDYLTKPIGREDLVDAIRRANLHCRAVSAPRETGAEPEPDDLFRREGLICQSLAMQEVVNLMRKISRTDANVLITGDSGTGKEVAARCLHASSHRRRQPFIPIDCASLPETLLESELFGHEKGAFTGAASRKPGMFELADGGTVLLDEIGEMSLPLQAKMLRVIQERRFRRIGGRDEIRVDVRILSATNRDLSELSDQGRFRQDLVFRLDVISLHLPPLSTRQGDIPLLANHFFDRFMRTTQKPLRGFFPEAMAALESHPWPGNVRELQNVVERAIVMAEGEQIMLADLPFEIGGVEPSAQSAAPAPVSPKDFHQAKHHLVADFERDFLVGVLRRSGGNISRAAHEAGINRRTLYRLIDKFQIDLSKVRQPD
jgi:two-component system response regulator AtoC